MVRTKRLVLGKKVRRALVTWGLISAAVAIPDLVRPVPTTQAAAPVATLGDYCGPNAFFGTVIREGGNSTGNFTCHRVVATGPTGNQTWNNPGIPSYTIHVIGGGGGAAATNTPNYCGNPGGNGALSSFGSTTATSFSYVIGGGGGGGTGSSSGNGGASSTLNLATSYTIAGGAGGVSQQTCGGYTYPSARTQWSNYGAGGVGTSDSTSYNGDGSAGGGGALIVTYTPPIPAAPMTVSASNTPGSVGSVDVAWQPPADDTFVTDYVATATSSDGGTTRTCSATMSSFSVPTTCTLTGASTGKTYTVTVKAYTALGDASSASSASSFVVPDPPTNSTVPTISGSGGKYAVGTSISATDGTWTGDNDPAITYAYQWERCIDAVDVSTCSDISGATSSDYTPVAGDSNKFLRVKVTATNEYGSTSAYSAVSPEIVTTPVFTAASPPDLAEKNVSYSYTFQASGGRVSYSVTWDSSPVTGLTIDPSTGVFGGTPTAAGSDYSYTVTATNDAGSVISGPFNLSLSDGTEFALEIVTEPVGGASGSTLTQQPVVRVVDEDGRLIIRPLTVTVSASPGSLGGTTSVSTSAGVATFNDLTLAGSANADHLLTFTGGGLTTNSAAVRLTPGAVHSLRIDTEPVAASSAGDPLATQPIVSVLDADGNLVDDRPVSISVTSVLATNTNTSGGSVGGSEAMGLSTSTGTATFANLTFGGTVGTDYKLEFAVGGVSVLSQNLSNSASGAPARLAVRTQPGLDGSQLVGSAFTTQPAVDIVDAGGNPTSSTATVTATASGGVLGGTTSVAGVSGTATFTDLTFAGLIGTPYTLTFTAPGLTSTTSASFSFANAAQKGPVSEAASTVTTSASSLVADGTTTSTITVTMKDVGGNAIGTSQGAVSLSATSGTLGAVTDHNDGTYSATFTSPVSRGSGTSVISATLGASAMSDTATIALFTAQTISFTQGSVALGVAPFALTATASSGLPVSFSLGGATTNGACTVSASGVVTVLAVGDCQVLADQSGDGTHAAAPQVSQTFAVLPSTPTAPFITSVTPANTTASVAFAVPGFDGGATITDYEYSIDGGDTWLSAGSATSPLTITGLINGTAYTIIIRAVNSAGAGLPSAPSSSFTPSIAGGAPVTTSATTPSAPRDLVVLTGTGTSVVLHWKVPVSDGGSPLTGYVVNSTPAATCTATTNQVAGTATCAASGLTAGQAYTFTVSGVNAVGAGTAATVSYTVPGGSGGGNNPNNGGGGGGGGGGTNTDDDDDGDNGTDPDIGARPGGPSAPPLPGTDDDGDGLPDPWTPTNDPNNVPGRPCSGCVQLFPAPGDDGSPGTGGSDGSGGNGGSGGSTSQPGVSTSPPGTTPGTITVTTGGGTTIVIGGNDSGGKPATTTSPNGGLVVQPPGSVPIVLSGLKPGSTVTVWLADNVSVTGVVGPDGTVVLSAPIPDGLDVGTYTGRVDMIDADGVARSLLFGFEWMGTRNTLPVTGSGSLDLLVIVMWLFVAGILIRASTRRRYLHTD